MTSYQGNKQLLLDNTSHYGNIIATQLAQNARDAVIQQDKISLQAMLSELAEQAPMQQATIYDLHNQAIAQAGETGPGFDYSASITFQDSIAGYAVITISSASMAGPGTLAWQLLMLSMILTGFVYASALPLAKYTTKSTRQPDADTTFAEIPADNEIAHSRAALSTQVVEDQLAMTDRALLHITITNPLDSTAMGQRHEQAAQWLKTQLVDICRLYEGQLSSPGANCFVATFYNTDEDNYPFRALCGASLTMQLLCEQTLLQCELGLTLDRQQNSIGDSHEQEVIDSVANLARQSPGQLVSGPDFIEHHSIKDRVETQLINPGTIVISAIKQPYNSLLDRQLCTLKLQQRHQT
jgi:uncharacterized membrane protein affecting hemolysin expression